MADPRAEKAKELMARGSATMRELLEMSFGEWPPKGLDINPAILPADPIPFRVERNKDLLGAASPHRRGLSIVDRLAASPDGSVVSTFGRGLLYTVLSHEGAHVLQGDHAVRAKEIFNADIVAAYRRQIRSPLPESAEIMFEVIELDAAQPGYKTPDVRADRPLAAIARIQREYESYNVQVRPEMRLSAHFSDCSSKLAYLKKGIEVQARLQQALIDGYQQWGRLPQNRDELWQAMLGFGLTPPPNVAGQLEALPADASARRFCTDLTETKHCREMSIGYHSLSDPARELFWEKAMPALYADLIEMYGDRPGRERFGLGKNIRAEMQAVAFGKKKAPSPHPAVSI